MSRMLRRALACALLVGLVPADAPAQNPIQIRYELGKRLQRLERALAARRDDKAAWVRARPHLEQAVGSFFGMSMANAERAIDRALAAVTDEPHENEPFRYGQLSLSCMGRLQRAVVSADVGSVNLSAGRGYAVDTEPMDDPRGYSDTHLVVFAADEWGDQGESRTNWGVSGMQFHFPALKVLVERLPPGDYVIAFRSDYTLMDATGKPAWTRRRAADSPRRMDYGFSVVEDLEQKLGRLAARRTEAGTPVATQIEFLESTIRKLVDGRAVETDVPANRLLDRALELAALDERRARDPASILPGADRGGDHWLMMTAAGRKLRARLILPKQLAKEPVLVVALHGMGGSEHMFVDGLGNGLAATLARERGWLLLSPRATTGAEVLVDAIEQVRSAYGVAAGRVCVVGHSLGAVKAIELAQAPDFAFLAMAPIGGGGLVRRPEPFRGKPVHVFTGSADFARGQCKQLVAHLTRIGADAELHSEPDIEHLAVVQWWLPTVFRFFDEHAK